MESANQRIYTRLTSREYCPMLIDAYYDMLDQFKEELGFTVYPLFKYVPERHLVEMYYPGELNTLFGIIGERMNDESFFNRTINEFEKSFQDIQKFLDSGKVKDKAELKKLYDLFVRFFKGIAYVWVVPRLDSVAAPLRDRAMQVRERTETYSGKRDKLFPAILGDIYPSLGSQAVFLRKEDVFSDISIEKLQEKVAGLENGYLFFERKLILKKDEEAFLSRKGISLVIDGEADRQAGHIKGSIAHSGIVRGVARLVFTERDLGKITSSDDILVSPMTRPEFIHAMKKAAAFVTDEGGITCHAAIVARELKKPCVIGTKIATQVFKDGDMVEVDAERGVVKKI